MRGEERREGRLGSKGRKKEYGKPTISFSFMARNTKPIRITITTHARLKNAAKAEGLTLTSLAEAYIEQGLKGFADTLHYFQQRYGKESKSNKNRNEDVDF